MIIPSKFHPQEDRGLVNRDLAQFGVTRFQDQVFDAVLTLWRRRQFEGWTQRIVADRIERDPAWVSKNLRAPANWTLATAGEFIQALDGEAEVSVNALEDPLETPENYDAYAGYRPQPPILKDINSVDVISLNSPMVMWSAIP